MHCSRSKLRKHGEIMKIKSTYKEICPKCGKQVYIRPIDINLIDGKEIKINTVRCLNPDCYHTFSIDNYILDKFGNVKVLTQMQAISDTKITETIESKPCPKSCIYCIGCKDYPEIQEICHNSFAQHQTSIRQIIASHCKDYTEQTGGNQ
jgi:hypothetical protein